MRVCGEISDDVAGKTTLLQTLCGVKNKFPNVQTDGIELKSFVLKVNKTNNPKATKVCFSLSNISTHTHPHSHTHTLTRIHTHVSLLTPSI